MIAGAYLFSYLDVRRFVDLLFTEGAILLLFGGIIGVLPRRPLTAGTVDFRSDSAEGCMDSRSRTALRIAGWGLMLLLLSILVGEAIIRGTIHF
jgi:uncharacterized membrane protein